MTKQEIDELWGLYREFCLACNQANMVGNAVEFLTWLEKYRFPLIEKN